MAIFFKKIFTLTVLISFQSYISRYLELLLPHFNLTVMIQEPNYRTKLASQIGPRKVKLQIFLLFLFFCVAFLQFLRTFTSQRFRLTSQYAKCESKIRSQLTGKKCLKSSKTLLEGKREHIHRLTEWIIWDQDFHIQ